MFPRSPSKSHLASSLPNPGMDLEDLQEQTRLLQRLIHRGEERRLGRTTDVRVSQVVFDGDRVLATAYGRMGEYDVRITLRPRPGHRCTCPDWVRNGLQVGPCKHVLKLAEVWWEHVYRQIAELEVDMSMPRAAHNVANLYEREMIRTRVASQLRRADEVSETPTLMVDVVDLIDLEYRGIYGRAATQADVVAVLQSLAMEVGEGNDVWPRNLWVDAVKQAFGVTDDMVLALPDEDLSDIRDLWEEFEAAQESDVDVDGLLDRFYDRVEGVLVDV